MGFTGDGPRGSTNDAWSDLSASAPCSVVPTSRQVIERKLLAALDDVSKVAILASKEDVDMLIDAVLMWAHSETGGDTKKAMEFANSLRQLRREAFPPNAELSQPEGDPS